MRIGDTGFLEQLRRRKVVQWGIAYAAGAWGLLQGLEYVTTTFDWSQRIQQFATLGLLLGLPLVLVIAWYHGDRGHQRVTMPEFILLTGLFLVGGGIFWRYAQIVETGPDAVQASVPKETPAPPANSIAVLPFADLSEAGDQQYFSDGIAEEILNALVGVEDLRVTSRTSAFKYRGDAFSVPEIAAALAVRHVVEGSVRRSGSMVRITAQLIDSATDVHLWSETYDRPLTAENLFAIQSEIATEIVAALGSALRLQEPKSVKIDAGTAELDTYEAYLRASDLFRRRSAQSLPTVIAMFEEIVADDPGFARGWAGLAAAYRVAPSWGIAGDRDWAALAGQAAERATSLDDRLALPYAVRSGLARDRHQWETALELANQAIARERVNGHAWYTRGTTYLDLGYFGKAQADFEKCLELEPDYEICRRFLAIAKLFAGHTDEALALFERTMFSGQGSYTRLFATVYAAKGQRSATLFLMTSVNAIQSGWDLWRLEADYRFLTDTGYSQQQYRADLRSSYAMEFGHEAPGDLWSYSHWPEPTAETLHVMPFEQLFPLWNPFSPAIRRAELRSENFAWRNRWFRATGLYDYWQTHGFPEQCRRDGANGFTCD